MRRWSGGTVAGLMTMAGALSAQQSAPLAVGTLAPDFALTAATAGGIAGMPVHLADFRGKTVVLAFFYKARTGG